MPQQQTPTLTSNLKTLKIATDNITTDTLKQQRDKELGITAFENSIKMRQNRVRGDRRGGPSDDNGGGRKDMNLRFGSKQRGISKGELS